MLSLSLFHYIDRKRMITRTDEEAAQEDEGEGGRGSELSKEITLLADSGPKRITQIVFSPTSSPLHLLLFDYLLCAY